MASASLLEVPSSVELLHVPQEVTARSRLAALIKGSLITEFPANRSSPETEHLTPDEAVDLLLSPGSPWQRRVWWSPEVRSLLEEAIRGGLKVNHRYVLSRVRTLSLPRQNISSLGEQMSSLSRLTSCSLASNEMTELRGGDLPRSLRSLQLYGNRLSGSLTRLLSRCPPLQHLGLGRIQLTDDHLLELTALLSRNLPSLLVLDLCDNHISDLTNITGLVSTVASIRSISLSGNPAFLATGYYHHFLPGVGRLRMLDGLEMTEATVAELEQQLQPAEEPEDTANRKKKSGKKTPVKKSFRRPAADLDPSRFEPSLTSALVRVTGAIYLPFVPKDQWPGQELCAVFQWTGDRRCPSASDPPSVQASDPASDGGGTDGLCPLEAPLQEKSDVTALETPLEWHCPDLRSLRDAMLRSLRVEVVRREKWTPPKKGKKGKENEKNGKKTKSGEETGNNKPKDSGNKGEVSASKKQAADSGLESENQPPTEIRLGGVLLPVRALLRPAGRLLLEGVTARAGATATVTETHWTEAILNIQEEKKEKKASLKKAEKDEKANREKRMSASNRSGSSRKKGKPQGPVIHCFFSVELYRKPMPDWNKDFVTYMPIDELE